MARETMWIFGKTFNFSGSYTADGKIIKNNVSHIVSDCDWKDEDCMTL